VPPIDAMLVTSVRLFGEALEHCVGTTQGVALLKVLASLDELRKALLETPAQVVLLDVTQGIDFHSVSELAGQYPQIAFIALGLPEQTSHIIRAGTSGFAGYVARDASIATLIGAMADATAGRLSCSGEIASQLLRALFQQTQPHVGGSPEESLEALTRRERDVARLVGQGYSNKEIARDLSLSLGTVKHHVHHVLEKLQLNRRAQVPVRLSPQPGGGLLPRAHRLTSTATKP
jgi:two-component system, NarL family, nitrate/nitrite response regulator NarL